MSAAHSCSDNHFIIKKVFCEIFHFLFWSQMDIFHLRLILRIAPLLNQCCWKIYIRFLPALKKSLWGSHVLNFKVVFLERNSTRKASKAENELILEFGFYYSSLSCLEQLFFVKTLIHHFSWFFQIHYFIIVTQIIVGKLVTITF